MLDCKHGPFSQVMHDNRGREAAVGAGVVFLDQIPPKQGKGHGLAGGGGAQKGPN